MPTFGEIYRQNNYLYNQSGAAGYQQQHVQVQRGPIIETPNSTMKSTTVNHHQSSLNRSNGGLLSPAASDINLSTNVRQSSTSKSRKQKFSSTYKQAQYSSSNSSQQQQQQQQQQHSSYGFSNKRVPVANPVSSELYSNGTERHFVPINIQEQKAFSSSHSNYSPNYHTNSYQQQTTFIS